MTTKTPVLDDYLSRRELAEELGVAERTVYRWHLAGEGPPITKLGMRVLYRRSAVTAWLEARERRAA